MQSKWKLLLNVWNQTKANQRCFNFQEQNCQHQLVSRALASTGGEIYKHFHCAEK